MKSDTIGYIVFTLVLLVAFGGIYVIYQGPGFAFLQPPTFTVTQTEIEFCCCSTQQGFLFEVYSTVPKDAEEIERVVACKQICEVEHSTPNHPSFLEQVGKCGF